MNDYRSVQRRSKLNALEELCYSGIFLSGRNYLLRDLVKQYPVEFVQFMIKWQHRKRGGRQGVMDAMLPRVRERVDLLYNQYLELKALASRSREEARELDTLREQLQEIIYRKAKPEGYTHLLDYDQCCQFDIEYGLTRLAYRIQDGRLHLHKYDNYKEEEFRMDVPLAEGAATEKEQLLRYLGDWLSHPTNFAGEPVYVHSEFITKGEFKGLLEQATLVNKRRITDARLQGESSVLVKLCREHGLSPEPDASTLDGWRVNCASGHPHYMLLSTNSETWGCGYCKKNGGVAELREWLSVKESNPDKWKG